MKYPTLLLILLVSGLPGCLVKEAEPETEIEKLPRATKEGRYTFGCLIDGKAYVSDYSTDAYAIFQGNLMFIAGVFTTHGSISFSIDFTKTNVGVYWIDQSTAKLHRANYSTRNSSVGVCLYDTTTDESTAEVTITYFDPIRQIVSGTFKMTVTKDGCDDVVITEGRFDTKFII